MKSYQLMPNQHQYLCRHFLVQDRTQLNTPIILKIRSNHLEVQEIKKTVKQVLNRHTASIRSFITTGRKLCRGSMKIWK